MRLLFSSLIQVCRNAVLACCLTLGSLGSVWSSDGESVPKFVLGRISTHADQAYDDLKAMNSYLRETLTHGTQIEFGEVVVPTLIEMVPLLRSGAVDMVSETPLGAIELEQVAGAEILLHEWKKGVAEYASFIIAHKDSGITNLHDLRDNVVAFEDTGSTSGFLIPFSIFRGEGFGLSELSDRSQRPPKGNIGYVFAGGELNIASLVARKIVDAGAISDLNWNDIREVPEGFKQRLNIVHQSDYVPRSTVVVRSALPEGLKNELVQIFTNMHNSEKGAAAMKEYHGVAKFEPITPEKAARFVKLREMHALVREFVK